LKFVALRHFAYFFLPQVILRFYFDHSLKAYFYQHEPVVIEQNITLTFGPGKVELGERSGLPESSCLLKLEHL
jgi:hypothetical protein